MSAVTHVEMRTYDCARHDECPPTGRRVGLHGLHDGHLMLDVLGIHGTGFVISGLLGVIADLVAISLELFGGRARLLIIDVVAHVGVDLWGGGDGRSERTEAGMTIYEDVYRLARVFDWPLPRSRWSSTPQTMGPWGMEETWVVGLSLSRSRTTEASSGSHGTLVDSFLPRWTRVSSRKVSSSGSG